MIKNKYTLIFILFSIIFTNCKDDDKIKPENVTNFETSTSPGEITLSWDVPENHENIRYIKINYFDPAIDKIVSKSASVYSNNMVIKPTLKKYGEYKFEITTVSYSGDTGNMQYSSIVSAPFTAIEDTIYTPINLTASKLSTNAQEPSEGPIANLIDNNTSTFFHTQWSSPIPSGPHWLQVDLGKEYQIGEKYNFYYAPRNHPANKPTDFDLLGSTDGEIWFLIRNFTKEKDNLPVSQTDPYTSPIITVDKPFSQIRYSVNETNTRTIFWTMSEFKFNQVIIEIYDPENE